MGAREVSAGGAILCCAQRVRVGLSGTPTNVARMAEDLHLPAVTLQEELTAAGFGRSYPTLVRELRGLQLRPVCLVCQQRRGRADG